MYIPIINVEQKQNITQYELKSKEALLNVFHANLYMLVSIINNIIKDVIINNKKLFLLYLPIHLFNHMQ